MEPQPDVLTLKRIYDAERQADRIVREAEEEADVLLRSADAEAEGVLDAMRRRLPLRREEALKEAISSIEAEARALLESAKSRTDRWSRERKVEIGRIADGLLERLLPS